MDQAALVDEQVRDGRKLIEALRRASFQVRAAGWLQESESGQWYLYIVSPEVNVRGPQGAYRAMNTIYKSAEPLWVGPFEIKLVGIDDPVAKSLEEFHGRSPRPFDMRLSGGQFGGVPIERALVYGHPELTS